jgi:hypothetical protein
MACRIMNPAVPGSVGNAASRSPFPYLGIIQVVQSEINSNYNAFSAKLTRRLSAGLTYLASYTWSKSLDNGSALRGTSTDILPQNSRCLSCDYGYSAFNLPNRFVTSVLYELPFGKGKILLNRGGIVNAVLGGWQLGSILTWQSGLPINIQAGVDTAGTGGYGEIRLNSTGFRPTYRMTSAPQRDGITSLHSRFRQAGLLVTLCATSCRGLRNSTGMPQCTRVSLSVKTRTWSSGSRCSTPQTIPIGQAPMRTGAARIPTNHVPPS